VLLANKRGEQRSASTIHILHRGLEDVVLFDFLCYTTTTTATGNYVHITSILHIIPGRLSLLPCVGR